MSNRTLLAVLALAAASAAGHANAQGDDPQNVRTVTAAEASDLPDDTHVRVEGRIVRSLGDEEYEFRDHTGTMRVEIDDDIWNGQIDPNRRVVLIGELDQDASDVEVEVNRVLPAGG
ncbi:MAG TPA: NirD/YgiW/YdeI family stress tolerance protein [Pseudomonadales bacterium]